MTRAKDFDLHEPHVATGRVDRVTVGTIFGAVSALAYTVANMALRDVARPGDLDWAIWVACLKAVPAALTAWILIAWRASRGLPALPPRRLVIPLLLAGLLMQLGGNVMFQSALGLGGLALTVPLTFATLIASGAWLGRVFLGEQITLRSAIAMLLLVVAIVALSAGAGDAARSVSAEATTWTIAAAVLAASIAGLSFGINGVIIRRTLSRDISLSATLVLLSSSGVVVLGLTSLARLGPERMSQTTFAEWRSILLAGLMNAIAFFSVSAAFKRIPVIRVNLLNASQAALAAVTGVLVFGERETPGLAAGTLLTMVGLVLMDRPKPAVALPQKESES